MTTGAREGRSLGELVADLTRDVSVLVRRELELARVELGAKATAAATRVGTLVAAVVVASAGLNAVIAGAVLAAIELGLPPWSAALLVGLLLFAAGALLARAAVAALRRLDVAPRETVRTLKETVDDLGRLARRDPHQG